MKLLFFLLAGFCAALLALWIWRKAAQLLPLAMRRKTPVFFVWLLGGVALSMFCAVVIAPEFCKLLGLRTTVDGYFSSFRFGPREWRTEKIDTPFIIGWFFAFLASFSLGPFPVGQDADKR